MKIVSFVPIKLNNQRLPGKNLLPLNGHPLCEYIFNSINKIEEIDEKYVYCSDESIRKYMPEGLKFLKRDKYLGWKSSTILLGMWMQIFMCLPMSLNHSQGLNQSKKHWLKLSLENMIPLFLLLLSRTIYGWMGNL